MTCQSICSLTDKTKLTLLLYSSTKLPRANLNRLSGLILQFMLYNVHGASYLYISFLFPGGGAEEPPVAEGKAILTATQSESTV